MGCYNSQLDENNGVIQSYSDGGCGNYPVIKTNNLVDTEDFYVQYNFKWNQASGSCGEWHHFIMFNYDLTVPEEVANLYPYFIINFRSSNEYYLDNSGILVNNMARR